jgi:uncharacterized damage-inducible protein DinB
MISAEYVQTMAAYNKWQNDSLYGAAETLSEEERRLNRGAHFGSIQETLTHILWGDRNWMSRFARSPKPTQQTFSASVQEVDNWLDLKSSRAEMDTLISTWARELSDVDLKGRLSWNSRSLQTEVSKPLGFLVTHLFNHQTHHRGQVHVMLTAAGAQPADTDLFLLPESYFN